MTKTSEGDEIVILARKEYDQLIAAAGEDAADADAARWPGSKTAMSIP